MTVHTVQDTTVTAESYGHVERVGFAVFMIVGPLILLAATIIHPAHGIRVTDGSEYYGAAYDHTTQFYIAHTLFFFAGVTLLPAVIGLTRLVRRSHHKAPSGGSCSRRWASSAGAHSTGWTS